MSDATAETLTSICPLFTDMEMARHVPSGQAGMLMEKEIAAKARTAIEEKHVRNWADLIAFLREACPELDTDRLSLTMVTEENRDYIVQVPGTSVFDCALLEKMMAEYADSFVDDEVVLQIIAHASMSALNPKRRKSALTFLACVFRCYAKTGKSAVLPMLRAVVRAQTAALLEIGEDPKRSAACGEVSARLAALSHEYATVPAAAASACVHRGCTDCYFADEDVITVRCLIALVRGRAWQASHMGTEFSKCCRNLTARGVTSSQLIKNAAPLPPETRDEFKRLCNQSFSKYEEKRMETKTHTPRAV